MEPKQFSKEINQLFLEKTANNEWILMPQLTGKEEVEIENFVSKSIFVKSKESHHTFDGEKEGKRLRNGKTTEFVLAKYLNLKKPDISIGPSKNYNLPDTYLNEQGFGVKCSELG